MKRRRGILKYHLHLALIGDRALYRKLPAVEIYMPLVGGFKAADKAQKRAFSAAGGTDDAEYLAFAQLKAHIPNGIGFMSCALIAFAETFNVQYTVHAAPP